MADDVDAGVARALRELDQTQRRGDEELARLRAQLAALVDLLVARGALPEEQRREVVPDAGSQARRSVRLKPYVDKYTMDIGEQVDCGARVHLCKGRCCGLTIELTAQDVEEGKVRWDLHEPYVLRKDADGRCSHQDRATGGCTVYEHRPATCRTYSCRHDRRIWLDFDGFIPAPFE
jgi:hypothetical protein